MKPAPVSRLPPFFIPVPVSMSATGCRCHWILESSSTSSCSAAPPIWDSMGQSTPGWNLFPSGPICVFAAIVITSLSLCRIITLVSASQASELIDV